MAKIAKSEAARTFSIPEWSGDMFLWGYCAAKFNAFWTAVEAQGGGYQSPDFWFRSLVNRSGGEAAAYRELILGALNDEPG